MEVRQQNRHIIRNKYEEVRSGWIIFAAMAAFYALLYIIPELLVDILTRILTATGDIRPAAGYYSPLVNYIDDYVLPVSVQLLTELITIAVSVIIWRLFMKHPIREMGLIHIKQGKKEGFIGLVFGLVNCSIVFFLVIWVGGGQVTSLKPQFSLLTLCWIATFVFVGFAEEILSRGFLMSVLRRTRNKYVIMLLPSVIFGMLHLLNPHVTFLSVANIVLVGILFSYIYFKSGNIWMSIGYHITWNIFQGIVYGMPVSGLNVPGIITTHFSGSNILNGGMFGIEGGILTTLVNLLGLIFVWWYYRNSDYDFISNTKSTSNTKSISNTKKVDKE